ncbi:chaperonin 10-like protein [Rhizoctonia solani]|nr:chaperonin 10-like protein [Rhizoctonia solani]
MSQHRASILPRRLGKLEVGTRPTPVPRETKRLSRSLLPPVFNPIDWNIRDNGWDFVKQYPAVLGSDGAGVIEAVGPKVKRKDFKVGDKVFFQGIYERVDSYETTFQEKCIAETDIISKIPENITEDEASTIPVGSVAALVGLFQKTGIDFPVNRPTANGKGVLILGGSSSVGQFGLQLARIAGFSPIVTTASAQHTDFLKSLGATHVFDRNVDAKTIQSAFSTPVSLVVDSISVDSTQSLAYDVLTTPSPVPGAHLSLMLPLVDSLKEKNADSKITIHEVYGSSHSCRDLSVPFWQNVGQWIKDGKFVPNRVRVVKGGLAAVPEALDLSRKGVSGVKIVVHPQE